MKHFFLFLFSLLILTSCVSKVVIVKNQYYPNGKIQLSAETVKNESHGITKEYNEEGELLYEYTFEKGQLNGITKKYPIDKEEFPELSYVEILFENGKKISYQAFYESGKLLEDGKFLNEETHGKVTQYYETGEKWKESVYTRGKSAEQLVFQKTGELLLIGETFDNKFNGKVTEYNKDGTIEIIYNYKDDKPHGRAVRYITEDTYQICEYQKGELLYCRTFDNGSDKLLEYIPYQNFVKQGVGFEYDTDGKDTVRAIHFNADTAVKAVYRNANNNIEMVVLFVSNKPNGIATRYFDNGKIKSQLNLVNDTLQGVSKSFYETGEIENEEHYVNGLREGISKKYYKNGQVQYIYLFKNDKLNGESSYYSFSGELIETMNFVDGIAQEH